MSFKTDANLEARFTLLRNSINLKYNMINIIKKYIPKATEDCHKYISILNEDDTNPSMYFDFRKKVWKCFSTGKGGGYLELYYWTQKLREGSELSIQQMANGILAGDVNLQKHLGFRNLFKYELPKELNIELRSNKIDRGNSRMLSKSLGKIAKELSELDNKQILFNMVSDFEMNMSLEEIQEKYTDSNSKIVSKDAKMEFEALISNMFGNEGNA